MAPEKITESWLSELYSDLNWIIEALRKVILGAVYGISEAIKCGNPTFEKNGNVCYLSANTGNIYL